MAVFFVNGTEVSVEKNQRLLRYLRDTLHLTSVKDGCSEGACGACTVLIDGETYNSCIYLAAWADGRLVVTPAPVLGCNADHPKSSRNTTASNAQHCRACGLGNRRIHPAALGPAQYTAAQQPAPNTSEVSGLTNPSILSGSME